MSGHLDFGDNGNTAFSGIANELAHLVLAVVIAVCTLGRLALACVHKCAVTPCPPFGPVVLCAPGGNLGEQRVTVNLQSPPGSVGQVQVQSVQLHAGHDIDLAFEAIHVKVVPGHVNHAASPFKAGCVADVAAGQFPVACQQFERLSGMDETCLVIGRDQQGVGADVQPVAFGEHLFLPDDAHAARRLIGHGSEVLQIDVLCQFGAAVLDSHRDGKIIAAVLPLHLLRHGDEDLCCRDSAGKDTQDAHMSSFNKDNNLFMRMPTAV